MEHPGLPCNDVNALGSKQVYIVTDHSVLILSLNYLSIYLSLSLSLSLSHTHTHTHTHTKSLYILLYMSDKMAKYIVNAHPFLPSEPY